MTDWELKQLFETSQKRIDEIVSKYRLGLGLTRRDADELRHCVQRVGLVAKESWIKAGRPDAPEFDCLRGPIKLSPLPKSMRPLDLTDYGNTEVH
jgi:hypothetical protein